MSNPKHTIPRVLFRYFAGRALDGRARTNATWLRKADLDLTPGKRAGRWHHRPGWHRTAFRTGILAGILAAVYGYLTARGITVVCLYLAAACGLAWAGWRAWRGILTWSHTRNIVRPLWQTLAPIAGHPPGDDHANYLTIPYGYQRQAKPVVKLALSPTWEGTDTDQKRVLQLISRRLGGEWDARWYHHLHKAEFVPAPAPPELVTFDSFRPYMNSSDPSVLPLGFAAGMTLASIDLDSEAPHIALSMGTGGGKTDTVALIIAYLVRKRCERIDVIDPKRVSHGWAAGLPGVHIHKYVTGQMEAIRNARLLMDSRYDALDTDETLDFSRHVLIIEEQNSLLEDLAAYWEEYRQGLSPDERGRTSRQNPAITDLRYILNKGRQCKINVISIYQRMSARASGGGDARENYGCKILARYSPQTWKILVGTTPFPRPSRIPGRAMFVLGDEYHAIQRAYAGIADKRGKPDPAGIARLRAFALDGRPDSREPASVPVAAATAAAVGMAASEPVSLREACESGVIPMKYPAARKARQRDSGFPAALPGSRVYRPDDLRAWFAGRSRSRVAA